MTKRRLRNVGRQRAPFGSQESAILSAAAINVAGSLAAAGIGASAAKQAAKDQANATIQSAQRQAQAIKDQTAKAKEQQTASQEFIKEENAENRELQKDIQLQLQMLTGQQNVNDRLEASKLTVRNGGKLRNRGYQQSLLRGGNMPFKVTDGGGVIPIGVTSEGFELYSIRGNDHEHYHKTNNGKAKSGVGIKFADGNVVEGEGNQNGSRGELMLVTPDDAYFISKHNINGVNPAQLVESGIHPLEAFAIQEREKAMKGINDDGSKRAKFGKRKLRLAGGLGILDMNNIVGPQLGMDTTGDATVGVVYGVQNSDDKLCFGGKRRLRQGGRAKAYVGQSITNWWNSLPNETKFDTITKLPVPGSNRTSTNTTNNVSLQRITPESFTHTNTQSTTPTTSNNTTRGGFGDWVSKNVDLIGAGLSSIGNIGGALITASGNRSAARTLSDAYSKSADIVADAYRNIQTINVDDLVRREYYAAAHAMPALQATVSFAANQIAGVNRGLQRRLRNAGRYSASSAAAQERMNNAEVTAQDQRNAVYSADQQQMQEIRQANAERVNQAAITNAQLDTAANQEYAKSYLAAKQYNNDIINTRILGAAGALSEGNINSASALSSAQTANAQAWGNTLNTIGNTFANTLSTMSTRRANLNNVMLGASTEAQVRQLGLNGTPAEKKQYIDKFQDAINSGKLSKEDEATYRRYIQWLS